MGGRNYQGFFSWSAPELGVTRVKQENPPLHLGPLNGGLCQPSVFCLRKRTSEKTGGLTTNEDLLQFVYFSIQSFLKTAGTCGTELFNNPQRTKATDKSD